MSIEQGESTENLQEKISRLETEITEKNTKILELEGKNAALEKLASTDLLTQIDNRRGLEENAKFMLSEKHISSPDRRPHPEKPRAISILVLDIDNFKIINDAFDGGHSDGDRILQEAAQFLKSHIRANDIVARIGGEEFAIVFHDFDQAGVMKKFFDKAQGSFTIGVHDRARRQKSIY